MKDPGRKIGALGMAIAESQAIDLGTPPWNDEDLIKAYYKNFSKTREIIRSHPGYIYYRDLEDLTRSIELLRDSIRKLSEACEAFRNDAARDDFWWRAKIADYEMRVRDIRLCLFNAVCACMALVDTYRALGNRTPPGYTQRKELFASWGPHLFIQGLRNYTSHRRILDPNWQLHLVAYPKDASFYLKSEDLLDFSKWSKGALKFIEESPGGVEPEYLFQMYMERVNELFNWFVTEFTRFHNEPLMQYTNYLKLLNRVNSRDNFRILLEHAKSTNLDPYEYIHQFLKPMEMKEVEMLPRHSKEQVDRIIALVDTHGAFDDLLTKDLYAIFKVMPTVDKL